MSRQSTDKQPSPHALADWAAKILAFVLVLLPFHALITISLSVAVGHYDLLRLWKEFILLALTPVAIAIVYKTPQLWQQLKKGWLFWCMASYVILHILLGAVALSRGQVNSYALGYALIINLRPMLIFWIAYVVASQSKWLKDHWVLLVLVPATAVIAFGFLQAYVQPVNVLQQLGYSDATVTPFQTVDQKLDYVRVQSTLRGANPLGAYLVLVLSAVIVLLLKSKRDQRQMIGVTLLSAGLIVLVVTYSRSAYVGMLIAAMVAILLVLHGRKARRRLAIALVVFAIVGLGALAALRDNKQFQNTFFHTDGTSASVNSSNTQHASALKGGLSDIIHEPFGRGPGTAGPASAHNNAQARIAEDYYLQIGQETGLLGLALFVTIVVTIGRRLFERRSDPLARMLLASLIGISFINLASHAWTDDTLALLWWGFAGVALATPAILSSETLKLK
jgi:hypothetical protein